MARVNRRDGQTVRPRNGRIRRFSEFRGLENLHNSPLTSVEINPYVLLGGCSFDTTEQHFMDHVTSKGFRVINCVPIEAF